MKMMMKIIKLCILLLQFCNNVPSQYIYLWCRQEGPQQEQLQHQLLSPAGNSCHLSCPTTTYYKIKSSNTTYHIRSRFLQSLPGFRTRTRQHRLTLFEYKVSETVGTAALLQNCKIKIHSLSIVTIILMKVFFSIKISKNRK